MKDLISLEFPLRKEIMTTVRLATGGVCSLAGLDLNDAEDCKLCVTESLLLLLHHGYHSVRVTFSEGDGAGVRIEGTGEKSAKEDCDDEISMVLLSALAGNVNMEKENDCLSAIEFTFLKNGR